MRNSWKQNQCQVTSNEFHYENYFLETKIFKKISGIFSALLLQKKLI